jgi:glycosyltransferase involved in cell wall biosynthesis
MPEVNTSVPQGEKLSGLSIVLPAYNEADNIEPVVQTAIEEAPGIAREFEVIVVDDGSRDRTAEIVQAFVTERHPEVRMLRHVDNKGYGAALRTGFSHARYEHVFYTDADRQFDIGELAYFVPMMRKFDVVTGFRVYRYDPLFRIVASWGYNLLVRALFRVKIRDVDCSFKVFRREVLDKITVECDDFFVDTELIAKARKWNFRIAEKGVRHYPRPAGETSVNPGHIPRTLRTVLRMWQRIHYPSTRQIEATAEIERGLAEDAVEAVPTPR